MADYRGYVTAAGQQFEALAKQMHYPVKIGFIEIGDGTLPDNESPISRTSLVHKTKQFPAIVEQDPDRPGEWIAKCHIPADDAINGQGYFIREMGCKLVDQGDGVLYAYRRISNDWKPLITEGEAKSFIYILRFIPSNGELIKPTINPSVVYVDKQEQERRFREHAAEDDPHSQYAKKANVPVVLDNMQKMAAALGNNPNYSAEQAVELLGKLAKNQNGADIPDKPLFLKNIGVSNPSGLVGRLLNIRVFRSSTTYVPTPGTKAIDVMVQGGGGAGGGSLATTSNTVSVSPGGNAGCYARSYLTSDFTGVTITIGSGGKGVSGSTGNPGGTSSFGTIIAPGGEGGTAYSPQAAPAININSSAQNIGSGGNLINSSGGRGGPGICSAVTYGGSGDGGESVFGAGGPTAGVLPTPVNGKNGVSPGSGGSGASSASGAGQATGGNGGDGIVIICEYA